MRRVKLAGVGEVVLADTVGFVRALPHELVAAFRSTLQEAREADLLLHVVDASDPLRDERIVQVREVLRGIGAGEIRELVVFNKIDLIGEKPRVVHGRGRRRLAGGCLAATGRRACRRCARPWRTPCVRIRYAAPCTSNCSRPPSGRICTGATPCAAERQCEDGSWELAVELDLSEVAKVLGSKGVNLVDNQRNEPANSAWLKLSCGGRVGC